MSGSQGYPLSMPRLAGDLIDQLDRQIASAVVASPPVSESRIQELMFDAGRRSIVDELVRLKERSQSHG